MGRGSCKSQSGSMYFNKSDYFVESVGKHWKYNKDHIENYDEIKH